MRLDKFLAESAIGNRKDVRSYIKEGKVKVNGKCEKEATTEVDIKLDIIECDNRIVNYTGKRYYMFNKPAGYITARKDEMRQTVMEFFKDIDMNGVFHVGRLDKDTEGLLLFTNDGEFEHKLMCPNNHVSKKYLFIALGFLDEENIKDIEEGIYISQGKIKTKPANIEVLKQGMYQDFDKMIDLKKFYKKELNYSKNELVMGYLTISEGRKHQVKRMLKAAGCYVIYLKRISIGNLNLDPCLNKGDYRELSETEVQKLLEDL